MRHRVGCKF